ncbi:MAG: helicase-related protein, partial [Planctomycetota bacterium]|nr:helicase-related protein [Planctomycetota bacterium]
EAAPILAAAVRAGTGIRTTRMGYRAMDRSGGCVEFDRHSLRGHFALAFSTAKSEGEERGMRTDQVRAAFNSPFWPFVLTTTSVGQEGLDFHAWCHAVVHWNLPSNPIDLEQREGRVHRFKGHAVRKNVAALQGATELESPTEGDPWAGMFERARASVVEDGDGLVPYWVFEAENGAHIERHVPALPHSKDRLRFLALQQSLALYRMVFGQPRQDDLMAFLIERVPEELRERVAGKLQVDLSPR